MIKLYLNCQNNEITFNKANYLMRAAARLGLEDYVVQYKEGDAPEYVLNIEPFGHFVTGSKWTGVWEIDLLCDRPELNASNWVASNDVFIAVSSIPGRLETERKRTTLLFQACDPELHRRIPDIKQEYDFVFSGTTGIHWYQERERLMAVLRNQFSFADLSKGHTPEQYVRRLNQARVQFVRSMKSPIADGELAQRFFECLAIGPVLTNYVDDLKHTGLVEGEDYLSYKDDSEMLLKMEYLVKNPEMRDKIFESGRRKAVLFHSYENRLASIINAIKEHDTETR